MASKQTHKAAKREPARAKDLICYICGSPIKYLGTDFTAVIQTDPVKARHNSCAPGTVKWLNSECGQKSEIREYFITNGEESAIMGQVPEKIKKAFPKKDVELSPEQRQLVGRVKYMAYMTTVLKEGTIDWIVTGKGSVLVPTTTIACHDGLVSIEIGDSWGHGNATNVAVLSDVPEANAAEELRSYFLNVVDEKARTGAKMKAPSHKEVLMPPAGESPAPEKVEGLGPIDEVMVKKLKRGGDKTRGEEKSKENVKEVSKKGVGKKTATTNRVQVKSRK